MKTTLLLATAAAFALTSTATLSAGEPLHSPRGKANQTRTVSAIAEDHIDRSFKPVSPRHSALIHSVRKVEGITGVVQTKQSLPVSPRLLANEPWRASQFQVAPLK